MADYIAIPVMPSQHGRPQHTPITQQALDTAATTAVGAAAKAEVALNSKPTTPNFTIRTMMFSFEKCV